jgi:glucose-1-phosphate adenylyltransferase
MVTSRKYYLSDKHVNGVNENKVQALILAGGLGERMGILCHPRPKPILPFACRFRIIDFTLSNCIHSGIGDIALLVDHQRRQMSDYVSEWNDINSCGSIITTLEPKYGSYRGTADAIYQNINSLQKNSAETTLVLAGDHVYRMDYRDMLAFHKEVGADVTIGVVSVPLKQAHRFGIVTVDQQQRIVDFVEKPKRAVSNLASMGIYIFNTEFLIEHLIEDNKDISSNHDFGHTIIPSMVNQHNVFAYRFQEYWQDIGTVEAFYGTNMELIHKLPSLSLNGNWPIMTNTRNLVLPKLINNANVRNSLIGDGCSIDGTVENCILFPGVTVKKYATIRNSIVMSNTVIGSYTTVDHSILDEGVELGEFCYIGFGDGPTDEEKGITVLGRGAKISDYSAVHYNYKTPASPRALTPMAVSDSKGTNDSDNGMY